jgi:SAM-dependent methyltransferase
MSASDATPELSTLPLVALVTAGLEEPAILEIRERFGLSPGSVQLVGCPPPEDNCTPEAQGGIFAGASGVSKLRFEVPWPADEAALRRSLRSLKGAQGILAPVALATVRFGAEGLLDARAAISDRALWPPVLEAWRVLTERGPPGTAPRSFRCSCVRDGGVHGYTSVQLAAAVGGAVQTLHGWAPSMKEHELEVVALLCAHELLVGVTVGGGSFSRMRLPTEPRPLMPCCDIDARPALLEHLTLTLALTPTLVLNPNPGSNPHGLDSNQARLRCSTAWLMLQLARLTPGAVVLDPMAGVGTVPLEAANTASAVLALGGDLEPELVAQAARNAQVSALALRSTRRANPSPLLPLAAAAATVAERGAPLPEMDIPSWHYEARQYARPGTAGGGGAHFAHWSAAELPLRSGVVDAVVVDLPFGMGHKMRGGGAARLYPRATLEAARVLVTGGRFVALTPALRVLTDCLEAQRLLWATTEARQVNCGGILAWVCVWTRSSEPAPQPTAAAASAPPRRDKAAVHTWPTRANTAPPGTDPFYYWARGVRFE